MRRANDNCRAPNASAHRVISESSLRLSLFVCFFSELAPLLRHLEETSFTFRISSLVSQSHALGGVPTILLSATHEATPARPTAQTPLSSKGSIKCEHAT